MAHGQCRALPSQPAHYDCYFSDTTLHQRSRFSTWFRGRGEASAPSAVGIAPTEIANTAVHEAEGASFASSSALVSQRSRRRVLAWKNARIRTLDAAGDGRCEGRALEVRNRLQPSRCLLAFCSSTSGPQRLTRIWAWRTLHPGGLAPTRGAVSSQSQRESRRLRARHGLCNCDELGGWNETIHHGSGLLVDPRAGDRS